MTHLTNREINGFIHHTLTDAQRETMNRHIQACPVCRTRLRAEEQQQRQITYGLAEMMRQARPSTAMQFRHIRPGLNRRRRLAGWRFHSMQMLSTMGTVTAVLTLVFFTFYLMGTAAMARPVSLTADEIVSTTSIVKLFDEAWDDPTPYQSGLILAQQSALDMLAHAPVYHMDMMLSDDWHFLHGRQQLRYVNSTGRPLPDLVFNLYPNVSYSSLAVYDIEVNGRPVEWQLLDESYNLRIRLPQILQRDETIIVEMAFELRLADFWQTNGLKQGDRPEAVHLVQFVPTLAMYDEADGWHTHPPDQNLLPKAQPGFYRMRLAVPGKGQVVGSGHIIGQEQITENESVWEVVTMAAGPVYALYLVVATHFQVAVNDVAGETDLNSYAFSSVGMQNAYAALTHAQVVMPLYNQEFGAYPFTELDIISMPALAFTRQGVAYPGVVLLEYDPYLPTGQVPARVMFSLLAQQWLDTAVAAADPQSPLTADGPADDAQGYRWDKADPNALRPMVEQYCHCDLSPVFAEWLAGSRHHPAD